MRRRVRLAAKTYLMCYNVRELTDDTSPATVIREIRFGPFKHEGFRICLLHFVALDIPRLLCAIVERELVLPCAWVKAVECSFVDAVIGGCCHAEAY